MAHVQIQIGVTDKYEDRGWTGLSFIGTAPVALAISNAQAAYEAHIDGDVSHVKVADVTKPVIDIPSMGDAEVERTGVVVLEDVNTLKKFPVEFKSIAAASIDKTGLGSQPKCSDACVAAAKTFVSELTGIAVADLELKRNYVTGQRS